MSLSLDMQYNRASFARNEIEKTINNTVQLSDVEKCNDYTIYVRPSLADIFKPMSIELKYDTIEKIPEDDSNFCDTCVVMDPRDVKSSSTKIAFSTGCAGEVCMSDLSIVGTLANVRQPFVLGSERTISIKYEISNAGEPAYITQLKITIPTNVTHFSRVPPSCQQDGSSQEVMTCDINLGKPVKSSETSEIVITLDATRLEGESFIVQAEVSSAGNEQRPVDNKYRNEILLTEFSNVESNGQSSAAQLSLEHGLRLENLQFKYKIYNNGPSTIKELRLAIQIPLTYMPRPNYHIELVKFDYIEIAAEYRGKAYEAAWMRDHQSVNQNRENETEGGLVVQSSSKDEFDSSKMGFDYEMNADKTEDYNTLGHSNHRRRRSIWQENSDDNVLRVFNQYSGKVEEYSASYRVSTDKEDLTLMNLPKNRTIFFDCSAADGSDECVEAVFNVHNFRPGSDAININMNFSLDLTKFCEFFPFF